VIEHVTEPMVMHKGATNRLKLNQLKVGQNQDVCVVDQYHDVFPKDMSGRH
jgi:hypothetical protein